MLVARDGKRGVQSAGGLPHSAEPSLQVGLPPSGMPTTVALQMKLRENQTDEASLSRFGEEAISLLMQRDFKGLADRFGYAVAFGRDLATAIQADLDCFLLDREKASFLPSESPSVTVKYYEPNGLNQFAEVACVVPVSDGFSVLLDLVVTTDGRDKHICLEDVSSVITHFH